MLGYRVKTQITPKIEEVLNQNVDLANIDQVPSNAHLSEKESQLYIFEDNEAVIKMIIKGRSPTMRHVSRTHRVALDWFLDRINLDPKVHIKYVESKNQLADILRKSTVTRNEWHNVLHLATYSHSFRSAGKQSEMSNVHLGNIDQYGQDLWLHRRWQHCTWTRVTKRIWNYSRILKSIKGLSGISRMVFERNSEINSVCTADVAKFTLVKHVLLKEQTMKWTKARVYVYSDSISCLGKQHGKEDAIRRCNGQVSTLKMYPTLRELQGLNGEWNICLRSQSIGYSPQN